MIIRQSAHFRVRMIERGIRFSDVRLAIFVPDIKRKVYEGRVMVSKNIEGRVIEVVYFIKQTFVKKKDVFILITAYYKQTI